MTPFYFSQRDCPDYVAAVLREHQTASLSPIRQPDSPRKTREPIVICVVKDELDRLEDFLRHYRENGIERFCFIDNGSTDGTVSYLSKQSDCFLYQKVGPFEWRKKHGWITLAIDMMGRGRDEWYLYLDADEHLVFDGLGAKSFGDLARVMERAGVTRVRGMLVDMYRDGPLLRSSYKVGSRLLAAFPYFDRTGYIERTYREIISRKGGPRQRVFGPANPDFRPEMTKYPLFKLTGHDVFANPHHIWPYEPNFASPCMLGILHFKFLPDTIKRIDAAIHAENYWGGSIEYKCYKDVITKNPEVSLKSDVSEIYSSPENLIENKIISKFS